MGSQWRDCNRGMMWSGLRFPPYEGYGQRKQAGQKGGNCSSRGMAEWVKWPVFHAVCSLGRKILPDRTNSTELVVAGFGGLTNEVLHGQCAVEENAEAFDRVRETDCGIVKLKSVDGNEGQFFVLFRQASLLSFQYLVEVCFVSSSFWCPNKSDMVFRREWMFSGKALLSKLLSAWYLHEFNRPHWPYHHLCPYSCGYAFRTFPSEAAIEVNPWLLCVQAKGLLHSDIQSCMRTFTVGIKLRQY